jgi:hypothetical protein
MHGVCLSCFGSSGCLAAGGLGWRASLHHLQVWMVRQVLRYIPAACFQAAANQGQYKNAKETACWLLRSTYLQQFLYGVAEYGIGGVICVVWLHAVMS